LETIEGTLLSMGLTINQTKTEIYYPYTKQDFSFTFLGYLIYFNHKTRKFHLDIPSKKVDKMILKLKNLFKNEKEKLKTATFVVQRLEPIIRG
jgi:hypothetical protein